MFTSKDIHNTALLVFCRFKVKSNKISRPTTHVEQVEFIEMGIGMVNSDVIVPVCSSKLGLVWYFLTGFSHYSEKTQMIEFLSNSQV